MKLECECGCGSPAMVVHVSLLSNDRYVLCRNCEIFFVTNSLKPDQFFGLIKAGHSKDESRWPVPHKT